MWVPSLFWRHLSEEESGTLLSSEVCHLIDECCSPTIVTPAANFRQEPNTPSKINSFSGPVFAVVVRNEIVDELGRPLVLLRREKLSDWSNSTMSFEAFLLPPDIVVPIFVLSPLVKTASFSLSLFPDLGNRFF